MSKPDYECSDGFSKCEYLGCEVDKRAKYPWCCRHPSRGLGEIIQSNLPNRIEGCEYAWMTEENLKNRAKTHIMMQAQVSTEEVKAVDWDKFGAMVTVLASNHEKSKVKRMIEAQLEKHTKLVQELPVSDRVDIQLKGRIAESLARLEYLQEEYNAL